jgi:hypothetical protein
MGTASQRAPQQKKIKIYKGVEGIKVKLIDWPTNPYRSMYLLATTCWGDKIDKWKDTAPVHRFNVVSQVLEGATLPLALEAPKFTFTVEGPSRASFDQIARARLGVVFSAKGVRDNHWGNFSFRIPNALNASKVRTQLIHLLPKIQEIYFAIAKNKGSWQAARCILPMNIVYQYSLSINLAALKGLCARRCCFGEQEDTVAVGWLLREALRKKFPLLGLYLGPACDFAKECFYHSSYGAAEYFGCLFQSCGRNPDPQDIKEAEFNESCSDKELIENQLGLDIPSAKDLRQEREELIFKTLSKLDRELFRED